MIRGFLRILIMEGLLKDDMSGSELISFIDEKTGEKPSPGSIYPMLKKMSDKEFILLKKENIKKKYSLTKKGKKLIEELIKEKEGLLKHCKRINNLKSEFENEETKCIDIEKAEFLRNSDLIEEFKNNLTSIMQQRNFKKKEPELRKILKETNKKIRELKK